MNLNFITDKQNEDKTIPGLTILGVKLLIDRLAIKNIKDLESRPIYIDPKPETRIPNNAVILVTSYPFGSKRCYRALWLEWRDKHGYRQVTCTSNKTHTGWNANKNGIYSLGIEIFKINDAKHFVTTGIRVNVYEASYYAGKALTGDTKHIDEIQTFYKENEDIISVADKDFLDIYLKMINNSIKKQSLANAQIEG